MGEGVDFEAGVLEHNRSRYLSVVSNRLMQPSYASIQVPREKRVHAAKSSASLVPQPLRSKSSRNSKPRPAPVRMKKVEFPKILGQNPHTSRRDWGFLG